MGFRLYVHKAFCFFSEALTANERMAFGWACLLFVQDRRRAANPNNLACTNGRETLDKHRVPLQGRSFFAVRSVRSAWLVYPYPLLFPLLFYTGGDLAAYAPPSLITDCGHSFYVRRFVASCGSLTHYDNECTPPSSLLC